MVLGIVLIGIATLMNSVVLARFLYLNKNRTGPEPTQDLPLPLITEWQDAADEWTDWVLNSDYLSKTVTDPAPAAVTAVEDASPWKNQSGIQQGVVSSAPAPPIVKETLPPLARPQGFV